MASSAVLIRRWRILRSRTVTNSSYSHSSGRVLAANQMITGGVTSSAAPAPWLLMSSSNNTGDETWRFFCCAKNKIYYFLPDEHNRSPRPQILFGYYVKMVGSSHGWLASYDREKRDLFLSDPVNCQEIKLPFPPLIETEGEEEEQVHSVVLSDPAVGDGKAFTIFGSARSLALCSPSRSQRWAIFGGGEYESIVYSTTHRRLLCLTSSLKLEAWDVEGESPKLDWAAHLVSPARQGPGPELTTEVKYIACEEERGQIYVVVRHVKPGAGRWVEVRPDKMEYVCSTVDFEALKIKEGGELIRMEGSLEGVTIFVGNNHPIAIKGRVGVKPDSIYFTYDKRVRPVDELDVGVFDYRERGMCRQWITDQIKNDVHRPVWFTPRHR